MNPRWQEKSVTENTRAKIRVLLRSCPCAKAGNIVPT
jgi:hypothetical protein